MWWWHDSPIDPGCGIVGVMEPGPIRLLVIDDSDRYRAIVRDIMSLTDEVDVVGEGASVADALDWLARSEVDAVLMDVGLEPGTPDGRDGARQIRALDRTALVVLCSAHTADQLPPLPLGPGVAFVHKEQIMPEVLVELWDNYVAGSY